MNNFLQIPVQSYEELQHEIRSGDILLCSGNALFSNMIKEATNSVWSHVAFILRLDMIGRILVLESVESIGVRAVPLTSYVSDYNGSGKGYPGKLLIARHADVHPENIIKLSKTATDLLGYPYDREEIVRIAARIGMHKIGINNHTQDAIPRKEFICSEYAYICFESIGVTIDYNPLGFISPADFANCTKVKPLSYLATSTMQARIPDFA